MKRVLPPLILLIITVSIFFNMERLDLGQEENIINLQSFVYLLVFAAVLTTLLLHANFNLPLALSLFGWIGLYALGKWVIFPERPVLAGVRLYLTINEVAFLALIVTLAYRVATNLFQADQTIQHITLESLSGRVNALDQAAEDIKKEFIRSRRHQNPISVLALKPARDIQEMPQNKTTEAILKTLRKKYALNRIIHLLDQELRRSDLILTSKEDGQLILLLPETGREASLQIGRRIDEIIQKHLNYPIHYGICSFPEQELTFEQLINKARQELENNRRQMENSPEGLPAWREKEYT